MWMENITQIYVKLTASYLCDEAGAADKSNCSEGQGRGDDACTRSRVGNGDRSTPSGCPSHGTELALTFAWS